MSGDSKLTDAEFMKHLAEQASRQHYFMVAGEVVFRVGEEETPNMMRCNAVVMSKDGRIAVPQLAQSQQALQMHFYKRMEGVTVHVLDVVILALMPLGVFTPEEFNARPEGMELREMPAPMGNA